MNDNAIKSLKGILSSNDKNDTGCIIQLKRPPKSTKYRPVLNYILVGNRYLVKEKWVINHEMFKEKARDAMRKSRFRYLQAHPILTKKLGDICTSRRMMSPDGYTRQGREIMQSRPHRRAFSPKFNRNENINLT